MEPNNYHGFVLEYNLLKVLSRLIHRRILKDLEENILKEQFGFRKDRSTILAIQLLMDKIKEAVHQKERKLFVAGIPRFFKGISCPRQRMAERKTLPYSRKWKQVLLVSNKPTAIQ